MAVSCLAMSVAQVSWCPQESPLSLGICEPGAPREGCRFPTRLEPQMTLQRSLAPESLLTPAGCVGLMG